MPSLNYETTGSELASLKHDTRNRSTADIIINEDWCMVIDVVSVENGIVYGFKVWDEGNYEKLFAAALKYNGKSGTPQDHELQEGQHVVFHRVGEYEGTGLEGFELHDPDQNKISWVCFIDHKKTVWVKDNGDGTGTESEYQSGAWVETGDTLSLVATDPLSRFYTNTPPWATGRVFLGQRFDNTFVVAVSGLGGQPQQILQVAAEITFRLQIDSSGKVIDFSATGTG